MGSNEEREKERERIVDNKTYRYIKKKKLEKSYLVNIKWMNKYIIIQIGPKQ